MDHLGSELDKSKEKEKQVSVTVEQENDELTMLHSKLNNCNMALEKAIKDYGVSI